MFRGPIVSIWCKEPAKGGSFENVRIQQIGGRQFLVGELIDDGIRNDPRNGLTYWFPVDDVLMITEFADVKTLMAQYGFRQHEAKR